MMKRITTVSLFLAGLFFVAALFSGQAPAAQRPLVIGMNTGAIVSLDPAVCYEVEGSWMLLNIYDTLVKFKPGSSSELEPSLATEWNVSGKTLTFTLRKGVKFSNGNPLDAAAVAYSLKRVVKLAQSPSWILTQFGVTQESITASGNQVTIIMDKTYSPQLVLSCLSYISGIVDPKTTEANAKDGDMGMAFLNGQSCGSGPYVLKSWKRNEKIVLERNPHYWGHTPEIQKMVLIDIPESSSQLVQLKGGDIDMAWNLEYDQIPEVEKTNNLYTITTPMFKQIYLGMNGSVSPLDNVTIRQAVKSAIDCEGIIKATGGGVMPLHSFVPNGMFAHYNVDPFPYNPAMAKKLLKKAGYPDGFKITLTVPDFLATAGTVVKANLDAVGIDVNLETIAYSSLLGKYRKQGLQMMIARWGADYGDPDAMAKPFAHCRVTGADAKVKQLAWRNAYANPEITDMVEKATFIKDLDQRKKLYFDIQKKWLEEGPFEILYQYAGQVGLNQKVKDFYLNSLTQSPLELVKIKK
jgi:peptide/nickel transport system substrate-binding protein